MTSSARGNFSGFLRASVTSLARKARVRHIVHQGIFGNWDCPDPHFAWHQMIQKYIESSGVGWTNLQPNFFMENLTGLTPFTRLMQKNPTFAWICCATD